MGGHEERGRGRGKGMGRGIVCRRGKNQDVEIYALEYIITHAMGRGNRVVKKSKLTGCRKGKRS